MMLTEGASQSVTPGEIQRPVVPGIKVMDVVMPGSLSIRRQQDSRGSRHVDPSGKLVARVTHHVDTVNSPAEHQHMEQVPGGLQKDV